MCFMTVSKYIIDRIETRTILRTIEEQLKLKLCWPKLQNNELRPKFTGSKKKKKRVVNSRTTKQFTN